VFFGGRANAADAAERGELVVFAVPGREMPDLVATLAPTLAGKVVIDATNRMDAVPPSAVQLITMLAPEARIARAFNSIGWENMADPVVGGTQADLLYCSDPDPDCVETLERLVADIGFRPMRVGGLDELAAVDSLLHLWFGLAVRGGRGRRLAFKILTD
jgi:predicted dinucleotide-binding enzyme